MKTESLWYLGERKIEIRSVDIPDPGPEEVLVSLEACGICNWDIQSYMGNFARHHAYPFSAGHEGVGRVLQIGDRVKSLEEGQRVAMHELPIGSPGGALLARHALRRISEVAVIPESDEPVINWLVEPVVCVVNGIVHANLQPGDTVAVIGCGYMGLLFIQGLNRYLTKRVVAVDVDARRLKLAEEFGAHTIIRPESLNRSLHSTCDVVIESAGAPEVLEPALSLVRVGGSVVIFAWHHHDYTFDLERWHVNSWRLLNLGPEMNPHFGDLYPRAISLMANGTFRNQKLVTHSASFSSVKELFETATSRMDGYIKGVVTFP
ncbi:MAG: zinc-binding dehydrogenase [Spirochaetaceae bacterium]|nr:MAG: zinc-binding dehydrogenase [Spirochaetaceae bacterium]